MKSPLSLVFCLIATAGAVFDLHAEPNWARFGGPEGSGRSAETGLPVKWDAGSVRWKTTLKGVGQSSVVNWGDRLFLTNAAPDGTKRWVHCLDRQTGKLRWEREVAVAASEVIHKMNTFASASCVTDGERVIAFFGRGGIHCFDLEGNPKWSRQLGSFPGPWGVAASPVIDGNLVFQNCDAAGECSLVALNKETGEPVWTAKRAEAERGGWSTPVVIETSGRRELVLSGESGVNAYDPATGRELWFCKSFVGRGEPVPIFAHGLLYVVSGLAGNTYALRPGGNGEVTATHRVWDAKRIGGRDQPAPAVVGDFVLITSMSGILTNYDAKTGRIHFSERLGSPVTASPLTANGLVYFQTENGEVVVIKPGKTLEIVTRNSIDAPRGEIFRAGLAPIQGQLFTRSRGVVYCISDPAK
ncbi:MAG: PQQ-binding-like beta-propeller repeat protein [Opitutaceae bacterium]|nr:PQQ-binding-like beta-propeller repeat protein [Opitutaceae bacterium]